MSITDVPRCTGQRRRGRGRCMAAAVAGTDRCPHHGGIAARTAERREEQHVAARVRAVLTRWEQPPNVRNPGLVLLQLLEDKLADVTALAAEVERDGRIWDGRPTAAARLHETATRDAARLAVDCARLGIDVARLSKRQGEATARAFEQALRDSGVLLHSRDRDALRRAFAARLRLDRPLDLDVSLAEDTPRLIAEAT